MKRSRRHDWRSGHLFKPCDGCPDYNTAKCLTCPDIAARLRETTHTEGQVWPQLWGTIYDLEQHAAYRDGSGRTAIKEVIA